MGLLSNFCKSSPSAETNLEFQMRVIGEWIWLYSIHITRHCVNVGLHEMWRTAWPITHFQIASDIDRTPCPLD